MKKKTNNEKKQAKKERCRKKIEQKRSAKLKNETAETRKTNIWILKLK